MCASVSFFSLFFSKSLKNIKKHFYFCLASEMIFVNALVRKSRASLVAQLVKNPPAMWETWVRSLDWEESLEKGRGTHSSILIWRIPWEEEPGGLYNPWGHQESDMTEQLTHTIK